jgi:outer membrane protein OmpA-like peptidoglycan-associated protein
VFQALLQRGAGPVQAEPKWVVDAQPSAPRVVVEVAGLTLTRSLRFAARSATLDVAAVAELERALAAALATPGQPIEVEGRAGSADAPADEAALAQRRADVVTAWLVSHGLPRSSVRASTITAVEPGATVHAAR